MFLNALAYSLGKRRSTPWLADRVQRFHYPDKWCTNHCPVELVHCPVQYIQCNHWNLPTKTPNQPCWFRLLSNAFPIDVHESPCLVWFTMEFWVCSLTVQNEHPAAIHMTASVDYPLSPLGYLGVYVTGLSHTFSGLSIRLQSSELPAHHYRP